MKPLYHVEYALFVFFLAIMRRLPVSLLGIVLRVLSATFYALGVRRRVVITNLCVALGRTRADREVKKLARGCYFEHGRMIAEVVGEAALLRNPGDRFIVSGEEHLRAGVAKGKGVIILSAHFGNNILGGYLLARRGYPLAYVSKPVFNPAVRVELEKVYTRYGNTIIPIHGMRNDSAGGRGIFRRLKEGGIVVVLNDQDAGPNGYMSTFFGRPTSIAPGPARFAVRTGAVALTVFVSRRDGKILVDIQPPIDLSATKNPEEAERAILDEYSRRLEGKIRETPELYFWFHRKWKSLPEIRSLYDAGRR